MNLTLRIIGYLAAAVLVAMLYVTLSRAHDPQHLSDWIMAQSLVDPYTGNFCCGPQDCRALPEDGVAETLNGFFIKNTGEMWPKERVLWRSKDGQWWQCAEYYNGAPRTTRCLIGPPQGL